MRYPKTQRAIVAVVADALADAGETAASINRKLARDGQWMGRVLNLQKPLGLADLIAIAKALGVRPTTLVARIEQRLKD